MRPFAVLHVPHSSPFIPAEVRPAILLSDEDLATELLRMTDAYTDELFRLDPRLARTVTFPISRLVVDPERFPDDTVESMASRGMGAIYTRTSDGSPLRALPDARERHALLAEHYEPHHHALAEAVAEALGGWRGALVVDCHSFPSVPLPYETDQRRERPEICIGTDPYHSPASLVTAATEVFIGAGFATEIDRPFSGALVPEPFYGRDPRVWAIMIEVNRSLYMDERSGERLPSFDAIAAKVCESTVQVIRVAEQLAGTVS
jgi:N-formylglutamate deformylase